MNDKDLMIGARAISERGFDGELSDDQVYRLPNDGWPIFKVRGKLAARRSTILAEIERRERKAAGIVDDPLPPQAA